MGLISRVSSRTYRSKNFDFEKPKMYSTITRRALLSSLNKKSNLAVTTSSRTIKQYWPTTAFAIYWRAPFTLIPFIMAGAGVWVIDQDAKCTKHPDAKSMLQ